MEHLRGSVLRGLTGDVFSVPKTTATLSQFTQSANATPTGFFGGVDGGTSYFSPMFFGGFGQGPGMFMLPNMPGFPPMNMFTPPALSPPTGDVTVVGGGGGGGPTNGTYTPPWPQNNMFLAEIKGWERAVAPPLQPGDPDPLRWIWKYKWEEVGKNYIWPNHSTRTWESNPGMQGESNTLTEIYAYNGCEYPNWAEQTSAPATQDRRVFFGPFSVNLEEASDKYLPFPSSITDSTQGWQDWEMFTDFLDDTFPYQHGRDDSLPMWNQSFQPAVKVGQPLPIGHHNKDQYYGTIEGGDSNLDHTDFSVAMPNVHVLMMERWIKKDDLGGSGLNDPGWCPDCNAGGTAGDGNVVFFDGVEFVCSYWFYATNARLDLPWIPGKSTSPNMGDVVKTTVASTIPGVPNYNWQP